MVGRLVHLSIVLPSIHHFVSSLRELLRKAVNKRRINLNTNVIKDLKLMLFLLEETHIGVNMNLLVYIKPKKSTDQIHDLQALAETSAMALPVDFISLYG